MKTRIFKLILEAIQTLCLAAVSAYTIYFLWSILPTIANIVFD